MKRFRFVYSFTVWLLLSIVLLLSGAGLGLNIFNLIEYSKLGIAKTIIYSVVVILNFLLLALDLSVMLYGCYVIKDGYLYSCFGLIRTRTPIKEVVQFTHFKKSNKLVMYFEDAKYTVIIISPEKYEDFILSVREENPKIIFTSQIDGEDTPE